VGATIGDGSAPGEAASRIVISSSVSTVTVNVNGVEP
jgi:hypothetical protein